MDFERQIGELTACSEQPRRRTAARALEIYDSIRQILYGNWDPIGISTEGCPVDESDAYIAPVYRILAGSRSEGELIECLRRIERDEISVDPVPAERLLPVAEKLLSLDVMLDAHGVGPIEARSVPDQTGTR